MTYFCSSSCANCNGISADQCTSCSNCETCTSCTTTCSTNSSQMFNYFSAVNNCVPKPSYSIALTTDNMNMWSNYSGPSFTCGQYQDLPGKFDSLTPVIVFSLNSLAPHVQVQVFAWVLWIDYWDNNNKIALTDITNTTPYGSKKYSDASSRQQQ